MCFLLNITEIKKGSKLIGVHVRRRFSIKRFLSDDNYKVAG